MTTTPVNPPEPNAPGKPPSGALTAEYRRVFAVLLAVGVLMLPFLPAPANLVVLAGLVIGVAALLASDRMLFASLRTADALRLPTIRVSTWMQHGVEIGLVLVVMWFATGVLQNWSPDLRVRGPEYSYLVNSGAVAARIFELSGTIPMWNPFIGQGEPMLESPFGFMLNPLMTLPIFWWGPVQGGKVAVLLHAAIMALGGWMLAYVLRLKAPGRVTAALMMGGAGGMAGAIGYGFYQMSLSQAYFPWVYAGLLGTMYYRSRRWIAVLAVAAALQIYAGTFWYVLPTALGCAAIVAFNLIRRDGKRWFLDGGMIVRLLWAVVLTLGISAVRLIPVVLHHHLIDHPRSALDTVVDFELLLRTYFTPELIKPFENIAWHYQYILPPLFAAFLIVGRLIVALRRGAPARHVSYTWRVVAPALLMILVFTVWAQEGTPFLRWLYSLFPTLGEWRFLGRMMAAALPFFVIVAAVWLDDIWQFCAARLRDRRGHPAIRLRPAGVLVAVAALATVGAGAVAGLDVSHNWWRAAGLESATYFERLPVYYLRQQHPTKFIMAWSGSFFIYLPFYEALVRASFGNPDYRPRAVESTIGVPEAMDFPPEYGIGVEQHFFDWARFNGYRVRPGSREVINNDWVWEKPDAPSYVFAVHYNDIVERVTPLTRYEALPIDTYTHHIDWIRVTLGDYAPGFVVVAQEVAFPGWMVEIDGQPAALESVGGLIGVRLPDKRDGSPVTEVIFRYEPPLVHAMGWVTVASVGVFALYTLRADRFVRRRRSHDAHPSESRGGSRGDLRHGALPAPETAVIAGESAETAPADAEPALEIDLDRAAQAVVQSAVQSASAAVTTTVVQPIRKSAWLRYLIGFGVTVLLIIALPAPYSTLLLLALIGVSMYLAGVDISRQRAQLAPAADAAPAQPPFRVRRLPRLARLPDSWDTESLSRAVVENPPDAAHAPTIANAAAASTATVANAAAAEPPALPPKPDAMASDVATEGRLYFDSELLAPPLRVLMRVWHSARLFAWAGAALLALGAWYAQDGRWGDSLPVAGLAFGLGVGAVWRSLALSGMGLLPPLRAEHPLNRAESRVWFIPFGIGAAMLLLLAEINGRRLGLALSGMTADAQFVLLVFGAALVAWGLGGAPALRLDWRRLDWALIAIVALALLLRVWDLDWRVRSLVDELHAIDGIRALGWNRDVALLSGMTGVAPYPWLYSYAGAGIVSVLGASLTTLRLLSAVCGALTVAGVYLLGRALFQRQIALLAALVLAALPAHLHYSRLALHQIADPLFGVLGLAFLARGLKDNRRLDWAVGGVLIGLSGYFHEGGRILFVPLAFAWLAGMLLLLPKRRAWLRAHGRGIAIFALAALCLTVPLYAPRLGGALTPRFNEFSLGAGYFDGIAADGIDGAEALDVAYRAALPLVTYVAPPPWFFDPPLMPGAAAALFMLGVALLLARLRTLTLLLPLWLMAAALLTATLRDTPTAFFWVSVYPALALTLALGIAWLWALLFPAGERGRWRRVLTVGTALLLCAALAWTYFVPWLARYNVGLRAETRSRDGVDVVLRADALPVGVRTLVITRPLLDRTMVNNFLGFLSNGERSAELLTPLDFAKVAYLLPRDVAYAFFIEPDDALTLDLIRRAFPDASLPQRSPYPYIAAHDDLLLITAPPGAPPPSKKESR
jgi:hypothetical protein